MKILVIGGAGFIGSHLCEALSFDNEVYCLDNYFTGSIDNHIDNVTYIEGSSGEISDKIKFIPDLIFHLGEYSRVEQSFEDIELVVKSNIEGTLAVIEFVRKNKCKIVYAGSSTKFGDNGLTKDNSPYAWTKASNTELIKNYGKWFNINYAIVYFYNAYGPREISKGKYATLIALFTAKMRNNLKLSVVKPGIQLRNFTHVSDIVSGLLLVAKNGNGDNYCIGNSKTYTILEVAEFFGGEIEMLPERKGNRLTADLDIKKLSNLGWKPKVDLIDYLEKLRNNKWES
ncbi:NAD-dependent epimerase/dehydratase family protein [Flavobacteriaceae bacterium]|nr:NAD-dependent epimerase/dehydratase family protein [Flavobacteriaceae bacterium]